MNDLLKIIAFQAIIFSIISIFFKRWVAGTIDTHFKILLEKTKVNLEIDKEVATNFKKIQQMAYQYTGEYIYRIRNSLRDTVKKCGQFDIEQIDEFIELTKTLTETLFQYSVYIDKDVFVLAHDVKDRALKAFNIVDNAFKLRNNDKEVEFRNHLVLLEGVYLEVDIFYKEIIPKLHEKIKGFKE